MSIKKLFGKRLRHLRNELGLSQEKFSEKLGLQPNSIAYIETARRFASAKTIDMIAEALNISYTELFDFDEPAPNKDRLAPIMTYLNRLSDEDLEFFLAAVKAFIKTRK